MVVSSGIDLIEVARVEQAIARNGDRFLERVFTAREREACAGRPERLAGRFAVKEAVAKALGTGIGEMNWTDIEVLNDERGKPYLTLHNRAHALAAGQGLVAWSISMSHTRTVAIGMAVGLGSPTDGHPAEPLEEK